MTVPRSEKHRIKRGLSLPIKGEPLQRIEEAPLVSEVAVVAADYLGMRPRMRVQVGDVVKRGDPLFEDRRAPGILYTSPGAGTVKGIHRGERRALLSVVIELDDSEEGDSPEECSYPSFTGEDVAAVEPGKVRELLLESGLWTAFRTRPFDKVPAPKSAPRAIFVTALDTHPLSPDPAVVLKGKEALFGTGLETLKKLVPEGKVYVIAGPGFNVKTPVKDGIEIHEFIGRHPAGTPGLAMHTLYPVNRDRVAWYIGYQDVAAVGHLLQQGKLDLERVVALSGPEVKTPRLIKTRVGASVRPLVSGQLTNDTHRIVSGSVLSGRAVSDEETAFLGRYHNQITALPEAQDRRFLGWLGPGLRRFSVLRLFASKLLSEDRVDFTTDRHGGERAMVPLGLYEKVWPFDIPATPLLRSLLSGDIETAEALGCLELSEEDVAVCSFVCPSKIDYGRALREMLDRIEEEG